MFNPSKAKPVAVVCVFVSTSLCFGQGPLVPPIGPPAPTMKTLQQIEPRIDLQNAPASAVSTSDPNAEYVIIAPGSYYLSDNVGVSKPNGIQISATGTTVDLNGFRITRSSGGGGNGVSIPLEGAVVRNGTISGFDWGIYAQAGSCLLRDLVVTSCASHAIEVDADGAVIDSCICRSNSGSAAIRAYGATIVRCTATANTSQYGGILAYDSTVTNCIASHNVSLSTDSAGFSGSNTSFINCKALFNGPRDTAVSPNVGMGFNVGAGSTLQSCTAVNNSGDGIRISEACVVTSSVSGGSNYGAGIRGFSLNSAPKALRIVDCVASVNHLAGIDVFAGSVVSNCTSTDNQIGISAGDGATITGCVAHSNNSDGIRLTAGGTVSRCTVRANGADGIHVDGGCLVVENTCDQNGKTTAGAGIHATQTSSRIEANNLTFNNNSGIKLDQGGNTVLRNSAKGNATNYSFAAANDVGPIGSAATATSPFANIQF